MYYVLKVGSEYLGIVDGRATLVARQRQALRFDAPLFTWTVHVSLNYTHSGIRFVKVTPRLSPADVLPDVHADIDAFTSESDAEYLNPRP